MKTFNQYVRRLNESGAIGDGPTPPANNQSLIEWWLWVIQQNMDPARLQEVQKALMGTDLAYLTYAHENQMKAKQAQRKPGGGPPNRDVQKFHPGIDPEFR